MPFDQRLEPQPARGLRPTLLMPGYYALLYHHGFSKLVARTPAFEVPGSLEWRAEWSPNTKLGQIRLRSLGETSGSAVCCAERLRSCEKIEWPCHSERSEESAFLCFQADKCRCFASLSMTVRFFHSFCAFPTVCALTNPLRAAGRLSLPAARSGKKKGELGRKGRALPQSGAAEPPRQSAATANLDSLGLIPALRSCRIRTVQRSKKLTAADTVRARAPFHTGPAHFRWARVPARCE